MLVKITSTYVVGGEQDLDAITDQVMDELLEIEEHTNLIGDSTVSASLATREVEISFLVNATSIDDAPSLAQKFIEQAIAATGGAPLGEFMKERAEQELVAA